MTILTTITAMQTLHATVDGVTTAPTVYPSSLNTPDLPCVLTLPAEGTIDLEAIAARKRHDGIYRVFVYVAPIAQGTPVDEGTQTAILLMQALIDAYVTAANIVLTNTPSQATLKTSKDNPIRHSALGVITFGEIAYRGFTFDVGVMEKW